MVGKTGTRIGLWAMLAPLVLVVSSAVPADEKSTPEAKPTPMAKAFIDGTGHGWVALGEKDFVNVNGDADTWSWKDKTHLYCTGKPVGVIRSAKQYTNFELVLEWRHQKSAGNSGVFVWTPEKALEKLKKGSLPSGIEIQVLDHGYTDLVKKGKGKTDWFTTNGDVFPVGASKMKPFKPTSPNGSRSFPRKETTKGHGEWNHYYIRAINGEVRLWVNGEEVSGGNGCDPKSGFVCLESEGSPIDFRNIAIRELP